MMGNVSKYWGGFITNINKMNPGETIVVNDWWYSDMNTAAYATVVSYLQFLRVSGYLEKESRGVYIIKNKIPPNLKKPKNEDMRLKVKGKSKWEVFREKISKLDIHEVIHMNDFHKDIALSKELVNRYLRDLKSIGYLEKYDVGKLRVLRKVPNTLRY